MVRPPKNKPVALDAYESLAERYAALIDTKPHNAYYERPAILSLLPDVQGMSVLDAGCGTGLNSEWLLEHGAEVVGVDVSPAMLNFGQLRLGTRCKLHLADLRYPLDFLAEESFDLVFSSLVLHYLEDWSVPLAEFYRVLCPNGLFVFSTGHPFAEFTYHSQGAYFDVELTHMLWRGFGGDPVDVPFYRRPLSSITEALWEAGFMLERLIEPRPTEEFRQADPEEYDKLMREPGFLCIRARKWE